MTEHDQTEKITCPHCKKQLGLSLDFTFDYENENAGVHATIEVEENG